MSNSSKIASVKAFSLSTGINLPVPAYSNISFGPSSNRVFIIPPEAREFRDISHTIGLALPYSYSNNISYNYGSFDDNRSVCSTADKIVGSNLGYENQPIIPVPILLNNNVIRLEPSFSASTEYILSCLLKYDTNFTNLAPNSLRYLSELAVLATQSLIYTRLIIPIENSYLVGGQGIGRFKDIVDSYQDANEKFNEKLLQFRGSQTFDKDTFLGLVSLMI